MKKLVAILAISAMAIAPAAYAQSTTSNEVVSQDATPTVLPSALTQGQIAGIALLGAVAIAAIAGGGSDGSSTTTTTTTTPTTP